MVMFPYEQNIPKEVFSNKQNVELSENIQCWLWQVKRCLVPMYIPLSWCIFKKYWCVFEKSWCLFYNLVMYMYILFRKSWCIFEKASFICEPFLCIVYNLMIYIRKSLCIFKKSWWTGNNCILGNMMQWCPFEWRDYFQ